jgi:hypothetical protein
MNWSEPLRTSRERQEVGCFPKVRCWAEGEGKIMQTRSLLLGVAIGLFGALAVLTARYVAVVLPG